MPSRFDIANALTKWVKKWGAYNDTVGEQLVIAFCSGMRPKLSDDDLRRNSELADFRLTSWHTQAANELEAALRQAGMDPRPGNLEARRANTAAFPDASPMQLVDVLSVLSDLRTFGPTRGFRPQQTFEAVFKFIRAFSRK